MGEQSARKLAEVIGAMYEELLNTVTKKDFNELKDIVKELADVQKRTEIEIQKLSKGLDETRGEVGGLSKSMSYAFENEAHISLCLLY